MQNIFQKLNLHFHGEGASAGDGGEGGTGVGAPSAAADAGQARTLEDLGVPKDKAERYRARKGIQQQAARATESAGTDGDLQTAADGNEPTQDAAAAKNSRKSLKDALAENPDWNREMQETVSGRVKNLKAENESLKAGALDGYAAELLAKKYGIEMQDGKLDMKELNRAITSDPSFFREDAEKLGVDRKTAMEIRQREREEERQKAEAQARARDQQMQQHFASLQQQAAELKKMYPDFDLDRELQNETFFRATMPQTGMTLEQAYNAIHYKEINRRQQKATAAAVTNAMTRSIQSGRNIPQENGAVARSSGTVQPKRYSQMTAEERAAWKREAMAGRQFR